jgi:hypothetical protein
VEESAEPRPGPAPPPSAPFEGRFFQWTPDDEPGLVVDTGREGAWEELRDFYLPQHPDDEQARRSDTPLDRVIDLAREHGVRSVVVERRYIDADYRSEHQRFYAAAFRRSPSVCHRLHFFRDELESLAGIDAAAKSYVGYSIMRPLDKAPVGRTLMAPPRALPRTVFCVAEEQVHLFGTTLAVSGMPFMSQDEQLLRCAHAVQWMVLQYAHRRYGMPRRLSAEVQQASVGGEMLGRQTPSQGLSYSQLVGGLHRLGLSTNPITLPRDRPASQSRRALSLFATLCRYVNSAMPPIVLSEDHAWVVVGYGSQSYPAGHNDIVLFVHDDARGPYIRIDDPWHDEPPRRPWKVALPSLPPKVFLSGERAEELGRKWLSKLSSQRPASPLGKASATPKRIVYRTYARLAHEYKRDLPSRGMPPAVVDLYRFAMWPRYVWIVEAIDGELQAKGSDCVVGEVILDATAHHAAEMYDHVLLALNASGEAFMFEPDHQSTRVVEAGQFAPYRSGCPESVI